jgi:hypothetical protein
MELYSRAPCSRALIQPIGLRAISQIATLLARSGASDPAGSAVIHTNYAALMV